MALSSSAWELIFSSAGTVCASARRPHKAHTESSSSILAGVKDCFMGLLLRAIGNKPSYTSPRSRMFPVFTGRSLHSSVGRTQSACLAAPAPIGVRGSWGADCQGICLINANGKLSHHPVLPQLDLIYKRCEHGIRRSNALLTNEQLSPQPGRTEPPGQRNSACSGCHNCAAELHLLLARCGHRPKRPRFLGLMLFSYCVRAIYVESCSMFVRGGVYRVVKEAMGGTLAKFSVSALMF